MVQKRDSGFSALPLCLHSGCASGSPVAELLLKFLYNMIAGKSLLEIVYNRFRSFRFFLCRRASLTIMSALRRPHSVFTPVVRPVHFWGSCYWNSYTTRAQGSCCWKSYTAGFDHSAFFFPQSFRFFFRSFRFFFRPFRFFPVIPLFFCFARLPPSSCRHCGASTLSPPRLCVRFVCGGAATGIPIQQERRAVASGNRIQPVPTTSFFRSFRFFFSIIPLFFDHSAFFFVAELLSSSCRLCGGLTLPPLRLRVRFACGRVANEIPIQHARRKIATGNCIQPVSIIPLFFLSIIPFFFVAELLSYHVGSAAASLCLHSGCASGSHVGELLLKFLYNTSAGQSLLEIVYNRFRYHSRLFVVADFFCVARRPLFFASHAAPFFFLRRASRVSFSVMLRDWAFLFHHFTPSLFFLAVCGPVCLYRFA